MVAFIIIHGFGLVVRFPLFHYINFYFDLKTKRESNNYAVGLSIQSIDSWDLETLRRWSKGFFVSSPFFGGLFQAKDSVYSPRLIECLRSTCRQA